MKRPKFKLKQKVFIPILVKDYKSFGFIEPEHNRVSSEKVFVSTVRWVSGVIHKVIREQQVNRRSDEVNTTYSYVIFVDESYTYGSHDRGWQEDFRYYQLTEDELVEIEERYKSWQTGK